MLLCIPCVIYLLLGRCLLLLSNQLSTSSTAWGFFFCSILLMLEFINNTAHCSGMPYKHSNNVTAKENNINGEKENNLPVSKVYSSKQTKMYSICTKNSQFPIGGKCPWKVVYKWFMLNSVIPFPQ